MIESDCPRHDEVRIAAVAGMWPPELSAHAATCGRCQETVLVSRGLSGLAQVDAERAGPVPDARETFLRSRLTAQIEEEQDLLERSARPLFLAHLLAIGVALAAFTWLGRGHAVGLGALASLPLIWMDE